MQQEGMLFPEMLLHQMLRIGSEHEMAPASTGPACRAQGGGGKGGEKPSFPTKYHWGKLENSFWGDMINVNKFPA